MPALARFEGPPDPLPATARRGRYRRQRDFAAIAASRDRAAQPLASVAVSYMFDRFPRPRGAAGALRRYAVSPAR